MSALLQLTIVSRDSTTGQVKINIKSIHPDSGEPQGETFFAMQILHDFLRLVMSPISRVSFSMPHEERQKILAQHKKPSRNEAPPLNDEVQYSSSLDTDWMKVNTSSYVKDCSWDKDTRTLTITPTHPGWTEQCKTVGDSIDSAAYCLGAVRAASGGAAAGPLKPIDRSVPAEAEEDPLLGFEMKKPKKFREDARRRQREGESGAGGTGTGTGGFTVNQSGFGGVTGFGGGVNNNNNNQKKEEETKEQPAESSFGGWAKSKASEKKDDGWGSSLSSSSASTGFGGGGFGSFGGSGGFGAGFGSGFGQPPQNAQPPKIAGFANTMDEIPDREIPLALHPAVKYLPVTPLPDVKDLVPLPVLYSHGFGGAGGDGADDYEVGTIVATKTEDVGAEKVTYCVVYSEEDCMQSCAQVTLDKIVGRAALMKPRKRLAE